MGLALVCFLIFLFLLIFNVPLGFSMGASGVLTLFIDGSVDPVSAIMRVFSGINSISMLAVPFFILSGVLMEGGAISGEIVSFSRAVVGRVRGSLAHVCVVACMLFASVSGSAMATALAFSNLLAPAMKKDGYGTDFICALQACGGTLGPIIPPSILMIMYCSYANISVGSMFLAGIVPGVLCGVGLMVCSYFYAKKNNIPLTPKMAGKERTKAILHAIPALLMPVIIIGGTMAGFSSPTEAGMVACLYGIIIGLFVYKGLKLKDLPKIFAKAAITAATTLIMVGLANLMGYMLLRLNFAKIIGDFLGGVTSNPLLVMLIVVLFLFILGMFMESTAAMIIFAPILAPLALEFGINPIQFGLIVVMCQCVAQVTPPVGALLSATTFSQGIPVQQSYKPLIPMVIAEMAVLILTVLIPEVSVWLPGVLMG